MATNNKLPEVPAPRTGRTVPSAQGEGVIFMITCTHCETTRETQPAKDGRPKLPRGWKRFGERTLCVQCVSAQYALRAVTIPVASCEWDTVRPALRAATADVTALANWLVTQLYASEPRRTPDEAKLPKWTPPYLYPAARELFPGIDPQTVVSLINTVQGKYRASRLHLWQHRVSLPTFRDLPVPINAQAWSLALGEDQRYRFNCRLGGARHDLVLRSGHEFARQIKQLQQILSGTAEAGEAAVYWSGKRLMLKIAAYFPRQVQSEVRGVVKARTDSECFLIATSTSGAVWRLNADHVRRWIEGFAAQQQRLREDLKAERRFPREMRAGIIERMGQMSDRRHGRIDAWLHEASAQLVGWCQRQKVAMLSWDDSYPSMMPQFPWYIFGQRLEDKCRMAGIEFARASEYVAQEIA